MVNLPQITQKFKESIAKNAQKGIYRTIVNGIPIDVFPYVFPPQSDFSRSTKQRFDMEGLTKKAVLDIGTGTGILAIQAALAGADYTEAVDIFDVAVDCARHNAMLNLVDKKIEVYKSDIFSNIRGRFDVILANLPILDYNEEDSIFHSLSDPGFRYHERLFQEAKNYLKSLGRMQLYHANIQGNGFDRLENLASQNDFITKILKRKKALGYEWRTYEFQLPH